MKACVIFSSLLIACSSHVINKRSLLGGRQALSHGHQGNHEHHQHHHGQRYAAHQPQNTFHRRQGRDGGHHHDESANEIRAAPDGYLPAAADYDYEEDLAGYSSDQAGTRTDDIAGYENDDLSGYESGTEGQASERGQAQYEKDQQQYGVEQDQDGDSAQVRDGQDQPGQYDDYQDQYAEASGAEPKAAEYDDNVEEGYSAPAEAASDVSRSADEEYGAPAIGSASNIDPSYTAPDEGRTAPDGYGAPEEGSRDADTAPEEAAARDVDGEYSAPLEVQDQRRNADDEYSAPAASDNVGSYYAAPEEDASRNIDTGYAAPVGAGADSDYSAPVADSARAAEEEYGAPDQYAGSSNGFRSEIVDGQSSRVTTAGSAAPGSEEPKLCPGGDIAACIMVCPGISPRVYGACVQGCADRCPEI